MERKGKKDRVKSSAPGKIPRYEPGLEGPVTIKDREKRGISKFVFLFLFFFFSLFLPLFYAAPFDKIKATSRKYSCFSFFFFSLSPPYQIG